MTKEFVPYEQALAMKELEFDEPCFGCFNHLDNSEIWMNRTYMNGLTENITAPTYSQAFRWFREKYKLYPEINLHDREDEQTWRFSIIILGEYNLVYNQNIAKDPYHKTYEEAELAAIVKLIEIVLK